jgi:hypothetical protein
MDGREFLPATFEDAELAGIPLAFPQRRCARFC